MDLQTNNCNEADCHDIEIHPPPINLDKKRKFLECARGVSRLASMIELIALTTTKLLVLLIPIQFTYFHKWIFAHKTDLFMSNCRSGSSSTNLPGFSNLMMHMCKTTWCWSSCAGWILDGLCAYILLEDYHFISEYCCSSEYLCLKASKNIYVRICTAWNGHGTNIYFHFSVQEYCSQGWYFCMLFHQVYCKQIGKFCT